MENEKRLAATDNKAMKQAREYINKVFGNTLKSKYKLELISRMATSEDQNMLAIKYATNTFSRILENPRSSQESYLDELELKRFDAFIILFNEDPTRFTREYIIELAFTQIMYEQGTQSKMD